MLTNNLNLPEAFVSAVKNDNYSRDASDITITQLISPAYQRRLREQNETVEDVADRLFSLYGQLIHSLLERSGIRSNKSSEVRLYSKISGWNVGGKYDLYEDGVLYDYKFTTVWSVKDDVKQDWVDQLNFLRVLAVDNGMEVGGLKIVAMLRDHSSAAAKRDPEYPQHPVVVVDIPMMDIDEARAKLVERVKAHQDSNPPICNDSERWMSSNVYAVRKIGGKRAVKLFETIDDAKQSVLELGSSYEVDVRAGVNRRCESYCNVSHVCPFYSNIKKTEKTE